MRQETTKLCAGFSRRECTSAGGRLTGLIRKRLVQVLNLQLRSIVVFSYCYGDRSRIWLQVCKIFIGPDVPGVRSMGPLVTPSVREVVET